MVHGLVRLNPPKAPTRPKGPPPSQSRGWPTEAHPGNDGSRQAEVTHPLRLLAPFPSPPARPPPSSCRPLVSSPSRSYSLSAYVGHYSINRSCPCVTVVKCDRGIKRHHFFHVSATLLCMHASIFFLEPKSKRSWFLTKPKVQLQCVQDYRGTHPVIHPGKKHHKTVPPSSTKK